MSEGTAAAETVTITSELVETETADTTDWKAEAEKWKTQSRKNEERAKTNADASKELEKLRQSSMNEQDKAVAQAKAEGRLEALRDVGGKLVAAEVRVAAAGRGVDVDALLEAIDPNRFLGEDGEPDRTEITAWMDRVAPTPDEQDQQQPLLDLGQGTRTRTPALGSESGLQALKNAIGIR